MKDKYCKIEGCTKPCESNRRYCREHYLQRARELAHKRYLAKGKYKYKCVCELCNKPFNGDRKDSRFCSRDCYNKYACINSFNATNNYERAHGGGYSFAHRRIAEAVLHRKLACDEVVHHIDCNPKNNELSNLVVLPRRDHIRLHLALANERINLLKIKGSESDVCWGEQIAHITTEWLETAGIKNIKISDASNEPSICETNT